AGAFHGRKTSRIRFWAFSYSIGDPCERSNQLIMYFIDILLIRLTSSETLRLSTARRYCRSAVNADGRAQAYHDRKGVSERPGQAFIRCNGGFDGGHGASCFLARQRPCGAMTPTCQ